MKLRSILPIILLLIFISQSAISADAKLKTNQQKYSYAIGIQVANNLKNQKIKLDSESLSLAISDVLNDKPLRATTDELNLAISALHKEDAQKKKEQAKVALAAGEAFQAKYKLGEDITTLENGMQYKILTKGNGEKPKSSDIIIAHYEGKLINGTVFDSSFKRNQPATFPINRVILGWQKIIPMMPTGSTWEVVIPAKLAYGNDGIGKDIGPGETLIFKIELISIKS